jgi:hypothetical protein
MVSSTVEQAVRSAIKAEIGEDENITFKQKNILGQKFGITPATVTAEEIEYWEMREREGDSYVRR